jgi:hypothetical protein
MNRSPSRLIIVVLFGLLLLGLPSAIRTAWLEWGGSRYQAPSPAALDLAATREPTATAVAAPVDVAASEAAIRPGPVVVDLAHYNRISPSQFQPLAARLAAYGVGLRFWMNPVPASLVDQTNLAGLSDQSAELTTQLRDASAMVVVSPLFLWQPAEIKVLEEFVADGGRLLLISDPDVPEVPDYFVRDLNRLGEPFGVVFNDDYLYDLTRNDENYTHVYQGEFLDRAAALSDKVIALYGVRSLSGPLVPQVRSGETTRSSLRTDLNAFTTVALAGLPTNHTVGRVLAMGDFDVLTDPYVSRHDNRYLLDFVADFLVGAQREQQLADFPAYLGPRVALALGAGMPLDAPLLEHVSQLQSKLRATGRTLEMIGPASYVLTGTMTFSRPTVLTDTVAFSPSPADDPTDLIYAATFEVADRETTLLGRVGIRLTAVAPTPQPTPATPTATPTAPGTPSAATVTPSATPSPSPSPTPTATPVPTPVLETAFSPYLLADDSVIVLRQRLSDGRQVTAVLGSDVAALEGGIIRLYTRAFSDCVSYPDLLVCPFTSETTEAPAPALVSPLPAPTEEATETPLDITPEATGAPEPTPAERSSAILLVDDNRAGGPDSATGTEASAYESALIGMGYAPELWQTASDGDPGADVLADYRWVIWSRGEYQREETRPPILRDLALFIEKGGRLTVSGRFPILGKSDRAATTVRDVELTDEVPELVVGLSGSTIQLPPDLPPAAPLENRWGPDGRVVLRRGPTSENAETPLMVALSSTDRTSGTTQRAIVLGIAVDWLPDADATQLVRNMAAWMMED